MGKVLVITGVVGTPLASVLQSLANMGEYVLDFQGVIPPDFPEKSLTNKAELLKTITATAVERLKEAVELSESIVLANRGEHTGKMIIIGIPALLLSSVHSELGKLIQDFRQLGKVRVVQLQAELNTLILANKLFGTPHNLFMPRKLLRAHLSQVLPQLNILTDVCLTSSTLTAEEIKQLAVKIRQL